MVLIFLKSLYRAIRYDIFYLYLNLTGFSRFKCNPKSNVIVSLTSFPERIDNVWVSIESIFRQSIKPWKVILVLAEEEFPQKRLPQKIVRQIDRGLEVMWIKENQRSYKKLIPVRKANPDAIIITIDDDIFYESWRVEKLLEASNSKPGKIIGHRGWEIVYSNDIRTPYQDWAPASNATPQNRLFLTSGGGTLFPPRVLDDNLLCNYALAKKLCATADDIWIWGVIMKSGAGQICLGNNAMKPVRLQEDTPALHEINCGMNNNDRQLESVVFEFKISVS